MIIYIFKFVILYDRIRGKVIFFNNQTEGIIMQSTSKFFYLLSVLLLAATVSECRLAVMSDSSSTTVEKAKRRALSGYLNRTNRTTFNPRFVGIFVSKTDPSEGFIDFCGKKVATIRLEENGKEQDGELFVGKLAKKGIFVKKADLAAGSFEQCPLLPGKSRGYSGYVNKTSAVSFTPRLIGIFVSQDNPEEGFLDFCGVGVGPVTLKPAKESLEAHEVILGTINGNNLVISAENLSKASLSCGVSQKGPGFKFAGREEL